MGNTTSNSTKNAQDEFNNFYEIIDYIATYYILTMDFKSLTKLSEKEYCDELVILTSDIIQRYFSDMDITFLAQRIKNGQEINELKNDKVKFFNKNDIDSLDVSNDTQKTIRKKRVCIGIAKFYVKIAHIFAAIVMTVNPVYSYKDETGQSVKAGLMEKDKIPKNIDRKLEKLNICDNRIRALKNNEIYDDINDSIVMQPKICGFNSVDGQSKTLDKEPGITELMRLYLDDNYDYSTGAFTGMSESTKRQYLSDLKTFYTAFTGQQTMPPYITKFSDIKLKNYNNMDYCQGQNGFFKTPTSISRNDKLFIAYANNIKQMISNAANNQNKLLSIINVLFTYVIDPFTKKKTIRINPKLTDEILQSAVIKTRKLIIDLYVKCETDYVNGVKLYEAIVEKKILDTTEKQLNNLNEESNKILSKTTQPFKPYNPNPTIESNAFIKPLPTGPTVATGPTVLTSTGPTGSTALPTSSTALTSTALPTSSTGPTALTSTVATVATELPTSLPTSSTVATELPTSLPTSSTVATGPTVTSTGPTVTSTSLPTSSTALPTSSTSLATELPTPSTGSTALPSSSTVATTNLQPEPIQIPNQAKGLEIPQTQPINPAVINPSQQPEINPSQQIAGTGKTKKYRNKYKHNKSKKHH